MNQKLTEKPRAKSKVKSKELIATLSQLESAITQWENSSDEVSTAQDQQLQNAAPRLAQALLKQLREQIDELSD